MEMIVFPDAAFVIVTILDILDVPVVTLVPNPRPSRFILVRRVGGTRATLVSDAATLTVESWGSSPEDAQDLAQLARAELHAALGTVVDGVPVYKIDEFSGPAFLPDPVSDQSRYSQTFSIHLRGSVALSS